MGLQRNIYWLATAGLLGLGACRSDDTKEPAAGPDVLMQADFEQAAGWGTPSPLLTTEQAHSGRWSLRVTPEQPFSLTYARPLGELSPTPSQRLQLDAWVWRTAAGSTARLVVQVDASSTDETKVFYTTLPLATAAPELGKWAAVHLPLTLPSNVSGRNYLKIYLWNDQATTPSYLDDVVLRRLD